MKRVILKGLLGLLVVLATAGATYVGGVLPVLAPGRRSYSRSSGAGLTAWPCFVLLLWAWSAVVGGVCAWLWRRLRFDPRFAFVFAPLATLVVFGPSLLMLLYGRAAWSGHYEWSARVGVLFLMSFLPSQVAFWGFAGVLRIGWTWRRTGSLGGR